MELNLSTFLLEIINFLVLVWILKRFFYRPVLDAIKKRKQDIDERMEKSHALQEEAAQLRKQYENRIEDWEQERERARQQFNHDLEQVRQQKLSQLQQELEQEREKQNVLAQKNLEKTMHEVQLRALRQAARFSSSLLSLGAGPETQARLIEILLAELQQLEEQQIAQIRSQVGQAVEKIQVCSAFPIPDNQQQVLQQILHTLTNATPPLDYSLDTSLLAGITIAIGAWTVNLNLRDELASFAEFHHEHGR